MTDDRKTGSSQSGNHSCYQAERQTYRIVDGVAEDTWVPIAISTNSMGVPCCRSMGELFSSLGYQSYEQAQAISWWFLANWEARPYDKDRIGEARPKVRIQVYDFIYDIKTYHRDEDNITIG